MKKKKEKLMENRAQKTNREDLEMKVCSELARCIWRVASSFSVKAENERNCYTVRNRRKTIDITVGKHLDQP